MSEEKEGMTHDLQVAHHASVPTRDLPGVNGHGRKEIRLSISVVIGFIMMLIGVATFASNFIFATKSEILKEQVDRLESEKSVQATISSVKSDVSSVKTDVQNVKQDVKEVGSQLKEHAKDAEKRQDVLDENLRRLLREQGVRAVPKPNGGK